MQIEECRIGMGRALGFRLKIGLLNHVKYRNDCISCLPDLITAPELVTALDSTVKILLVTLLYH